jgi:hypothetical protein
METHPTATEGGTTLRIYSILYSYPTWDRYYRGQRGERIEATSPADAIRRVREGRGGYGPCPGATIVRCKDVTERYQAARS